MQKVNGDIIRKMIAAGGAKAPAPVSLGDVSSQAALDISGVLTTHFDVKTSANCVRSTSAPMNKLVETFAEGQIAFFYKIKDEIECFVFLDIEAITIGASWSHERKLLTEVSEDAKPSVVDQFLAEALLRSMLQTLARDRKQPEGAALPEIELLDVGDDPKQFVLDNETAPAQLLAFEPETVNGEKLGGYFLLVPDSVLSQLSDGKPAAPDKNQIKWKTRLGEIAQDAYVDTRIVVAQESVDMSALAALKPGDVISLREASLDAAEITCGSAANNLRIGSGAIRTLKDRRALKVIDSTLAANAVPEVA